ncbi:endonuclease/exonuclease/phosphatase family protein [Nocardioides sp. SR21]|uniref:endonuclease/exonuclease/phosphatase family protein n=1 Tax=Nocardioides sp. SR21 TaxID=2919501 RepID=UPI001FAA9357|nr:endonuclease/exonuclease/phosphatase family protein [Nocardioides sp. SR21]
MRARQLVFWGIVALLLLPAAALTFSRVVEPDSGFWVQLEAFTPFGLVLYAAAALLLGCRLLVGRRVRSVVTVVAVAAVLGLALHAWWFAPRVTGANPPAAAGAEPLVVMTANISSGEADGIDLVQRATEEEVDLLAVQEITAADLADMDRAGLAELLPYRVGGPGTHGDGTMVFARTELAGAEPLATTNDGWVVTMGDLTVMAVHPWAPTEPELWTAEHAILEEAVAEHDPDLLVGDFNATLDHAPMRALSDAGYRDVGELANQGWLPTWPASGTVDVLGVGLPALVQIDHVLVGPGLAALGMHTVELPGSDHRAVVAEVARK